MTVTNLHPMTLALAKETLAAIGYNPEWTIDELAEAVPADMIERVVAALRVTAAAEHAEANSMEVLRNG